MQPAITNTRNPSIDLIKIVAMSLVVCLHTVRMVANPDYPEISQVLYNCGVIAIPLFFMVSGYLLIGRQGVLYKYSFKKIFSILKFIFIFDLITWVFFYSFSIRDIHDLVYDFAFSFIQNGNLWFFWFLGSMIIIYLIYPIINRLFENRKGYILLLVALLIIQNYAFISNVVGYGEAKITQTFRIWNWASYFMLGGMIKKLVLSRKLLWISTLFSLLATAFTMAWLYPFMKAEYCEYFYSSPTVIALTICVFMLLKSFRIRDSRILREIALLFLPVYALHTMIRIWIIGIYFYEYVQWLKTMVFGCVLYWFTVLLASCLISYIIMKTPYINRIFRL